MRKKLEIPALETAKWLLVLLILVFLLGISVQGKESQTEFSAMAEAIADTADLTEMQEADNQMIRRLYGLEPGEYEGILLYYPATNMGAEEILLVKTSDSAQQETVSDAIEARIAAQMASFDGYGIDQYEMLENSVEEIQGGYILLVVAPDPAPVRQIFLDLL